MADSVVSPEAMSDSGGPPPADGDDFYRRLGLIPFESNTEVISSRARELMRERRKYQLGAYAAKAQSQLEELANATACLLDPSRKQVYDDNLRRLYGLPPISVASTYVSAAREVPRPESAAIIETQRRGARQRWKLAVMAVLAAAPIVLAFRLFVPRPAGTLSPTVVPAPVAKTPGRASTDNIELGHPTAVPTTASKRPAPASHAAISAPKLNPISPVRGWKDEQPRNAANASSERRSEPGDRGDSATADVKPTRRPKMTVAERAVAVPSSPATSSSPMPDSATMPVPHAVAKPPVDPGLQLSSNDVLRELREIRMKRPPALRLSSGKSSLGSERVVELVRYARTTYGDERQFQRQLDQEVAALKRVYPQLRDLLSDPTR